jgi:hypothetical protein
MALSRQLLREPVPLAKYKIFVFFLFTHSYSVAIEGCGYPATTGTTTAYYVSMGPTIDEKKPCCA